LFSNISITAVRLNECIPATFHQVNHCHLLFLLYWMPKHVCNFYQLSNCEISVWTYNHIRLNIQVHIYYSISSAPTGIIFLDLVLVIEYSNVNVFGYSLFSLNWMYSKFSKSLARIPVLTASLISKPNAFQSFF
jgi:hypothetical protein